MFIAKIEITEDAKKDEKRSSAIIGGATYIFLYFSGPLILFDFERYPKLVADQRECVDSDVVFPLLDTADVLEGDACLLCEIPE